VFNEKIIFIRKYHFLIDCIIPKTKIGGNESNVLFYELTLSAIIFVSDAISCRILPDSITRWNRSEPVFLCDLSFFENPSPLFRNNGCATIRLRITSLLPRHVRFHLTLMYALSYSEKTYRLSCCEPDGLRLDRPEYFCQVQYTHVTGSIASLSGKFIKQICLRHILLIASSEHMSIKKIKDNNINSIH